MLQIIIPSVELWDERNQVFLRTKETKLQLEHSLVSIAKWESKWNKPFLTNKKKTYKETIDYIRCMTMTQNVKPEIYNLLTESNISDIEEYINAPMTATTFSEEENKKKNRDVITAEIIYWWMISLNIPIEFQKWHLNRLLTLIRVCNIKNQPPKKMNKREVFRRNSELNKARRRQLNSKG